MRAKTVNFERGLDPKDSLEIGNKNIRSFRNVLNEKDYLSPHLQTMILGLTEGSIQEKDAIQFVEGAIKYYDKNRELLWYDWYFDNGYCFWAKDVQKFVITFSLPEDDYWGVLNIRTEIFESKSLQYASPVFESNSILYSHNFTNQRRADHFHQNHMFHPDDPVFKMGVIINQITRVVEASIKNMG